MTAVLKTSFLACDIFLYALSGQKDIKQVVPIKLSILRPKKKKYWTFEFVNRWWSARANQVRDNSRIRNANLFYLKRNHFVKNPSRILDKTLFIITAIYQTPIVKLTDFSRQKKVVWDAICKFLTLFNTLKPVDTIKSFNHMPSEWTVLNGEMST